MFGIYLHIPFCKSRCAYCDFFSTTLLDKRKEYVDALIREAKQRLNDYPTADTIYFGGGTPSLLAIEDIQRIIKILPNGAKEITLEANPGDLTDEKLTAYKQIGINRLSIGIQAFNDDLLKLIGRRHNSQQAIEAVKLAQQAGFDNISIDLIYGLPNQTITDWKWEIEQALNLNIQHISTYCLSYEHNTKLTQWLEKGIIKEVDEDIELEMYDFLVKKLGQHGFIQYEVSNFCKMGYHSRHNSSYWNQTPYCGLGAGAHSYNGKEIRRWNINNVDEYINCINNNSSYFEEEILQPIDQYNERIMLGLRTTNGIDLSSFNADEQEYIRKEASCYIKNNQLVLTQNNLRATIKGFHILNRIIEDLMME